MDNEINSNPFDEDKSINSTSAFGDSDLKPIDDESSGRTFVWLILGAAAIGCGLLFAVAFIFFKPDAQSLLGKYFPSPTVTFTSTPTLTPTLTLTPTNTATPTNTTTPTPNMTAQAYEATAVYAAGQWNEIISEQFETNESNWYTGTDDDAYAKIIYTVENGQYTWDATAHQGFIQRIWVNSISVGDFYFSLDVTQPSFTTAADYGIVFREDNANNYYYFSINNKKQFSLWLHYQDEWTELIDSSVSQAILPRESNRLAVLAKGDHFVLFINDQYVAEIQDGTLDKGRAGMAIEISEPDLGVLFEFDNLLLKLPK